jgi:putative aldouronate transport system permease protein
MKQKFSFAPEYLPRTIFVIFNVIFFIIVMAAMLVPIIKVLIDSISRSVIYGFGFPSLDNITFDAYVLICQQESLWMPFIVSVITTIIGTFLGLAISTVGAYILIQKDMPGVKIFSYLFMFTMIFNGGLVPTFLVMKDLHLLNTYWSVIVTLAMNVYNLVLMRSFFEQIPESLFEAADLDGCSPMGIFIKIVLPLSKPALASIGLFFAVAMWSEYFHYVLYIFDTSKQNFQAKLRSLIIDDTPIAGANELGLSMKTVQNAAIIICILPFMFIYPFCQRYFISGVTMGAVKE